MGDIWVFLMFILKNFFIENEIKRLFFYLKMVK